MPAAKPKSKNPDKKLDVVTTPAEEVTPTAISDLRPAGYNPRVITAEQQKMLQASMKEYGDLGGIVFNTKTGRLVGGHQRVKQLDPAWNIVKETQTDSSGTVASGYIETPHGRFSYREVAWSETKEKAANIAANKMGGSFDDELLTQLLQELDSNGFDMSLTGFNEDELKELLQEKKEQLGEEDPEVEPVEEPFVKLGDMWLLRESRLLVGDSTSLADVDRLMQGDKADLILTDPPYNVAYEGAAGKIENDNMSAAAFSQFLQGVFSVMNHALKKGGCFYIYHAEGQELVGHTFQDAVINTKGLLLKQKLVWVKNAAPMSRQDYSWKHEPILYGWKEGAAHYYDGDFTRTTVIDDDLDISKLDKKALQTLVSEMRNQERTTVIRVDKPAKSVWHPTTKPVRLFEKNIYASTRPNEIVLDLFSGSGTTIITCRKTGRKGRGMEFSPGYAQASLKRYWEYCGEEPLLYGADGTMIPFSEVEKQRKKK